MDTIREIALYSILGKPVVVYFGILTFASFGVTAMIGLENFKGKRRVPFKWHPRMVVISFAIALIHMTLAVSLFAG